MKDAPCLGLLAVFAALGVGPRAWAGDDPNDFFEAKVRPVLVEKCQPCHGGEALKGRLDLTSRAALLKGGRSGPAAIPGRADESLLIEALQYETEPRMPPKGRLSDGEIAALSRWVELGLPWPGTETARKGPETDDKSRSTLTHWAFQPVRAVTPPDVRDGAWVRTPIDRFVLAKLGAAGLAPSPAADRRTLIRRMTRDLTGLPPTYEDVTTFVHDDRPDAVERLVDRLLTSPHHGEQWARHWLDVPRYSDTKGYVYAREERFWVHAWPYRDWVVRALNEDMAYDRFLLLQLAADRVAGDDKGALAAMGFLTLGRRFLGVTHDIIDDRIDVVTRATLGLTVACARCHDHKFDPVPTRDYYALYGIFRNTSERLVEARPADATDAFRKGLAERQAKLDKRLGEERKAAADRVRSRLTEYLLAQLEMQKYPEEGFDQVLEKGDIIPAFVRRWRDAIARAALAGDPVFRPWAAFAKLKPDEFAGRAAEVVEAVRGPTEPTVAMAFEAPPASMREVAERYGALFAKALEEKSEGPLHRFLFGPDAPCEVPDEPIVNTEAFFPTSTLDDLWKLQGEVDRWLIKSAESPGHAMVLVDRSPTVEARVFRRGNPANLGEEVPRRFLSALSGPNASPFQDGSGRLELARAIIDPTNPLTARVLVNRVWAHHFGVGLVATPSDFGTRAGQPSHPELLDWLAERFIADGWSMKSLHRLILMSSTYQQTSFGSLDKGRREQAERLDPENRLLWKGHAHRLSFEELRDAVLSVTGELDKRLGGKPVDLFAAPFPVRRTVYGLVDRQEFPSVLRVFDFANPDLHVPQRGETIVPQQALFFLNHTFLVGRARALIERSDVNAEATDEAKVVKLFQLLHQRMPTQSQLETALRLIRDTELDREPEPPPTAKDWQYGFGEVDDAAGVLKAFQALPHFGEGAWQGGPAWPDPKLGWVQLNAEGGHPGNDKAHAAVRRWVAPRDAVVSIQSTLIHEVKQGDGVLGWLIVGGRGAMKSAVVHNGRVPFDVGRVRVRHGETIDFVVNIRDDLNSDQFRWAPVIVEDGGTTVWDAAHDFLGPTSPRLTPWEQLAQALLMTNEFAFDD